MRTFLVIILLAGAGWYIFKPQSNLEILMEGSEPYLETENSGIFDVVPNRGFARDIRELGIPGHITVVEFYDPKCRGCTIMESDLKKLNRIRPDVTIKLIHMSKNYYGFWGEHFGLDVLHVPFTVILDKQGEILAQDQGEEDDDQNLLLEWINAELRRR